jgi:pyruvate dehydrogenase E1 component beta subunit
VSATRESTVTLRSAINGGLHAAMAEDDAVVMLGEDVGRTGGVFRVTSGLQETYGAERVIDTPLAEAGLVGTAIGLAMGGLRPVIEVQFDGFVYPAMNQIVSHLAKMPTRYDEPGLLPICLRLPYGGRIRAVEHHSESPEAYFAHTPHLRVVSASDPRTAKALLLAAVRSDEPYVFLEPKRFYAAPRAPEAEEIAEVDPNKSRLVRKGSDALIIAYGPTLDIALKAAADERLDGAVVGVLDLVSLAPLDVDGVLSAVRATGRVVVVSEAIRRCSVASEVVSWIATDDGVDLVARPAIVCARDAPYPAAASEDEFLPSLDDVVDAVRKVLGR